MDRIIHLGKMGEKNIFIPQAMEHSVYHGDADIDKLMRVKRSIISEDNAETLHTLQKQGEKSWH